MLSMRSAWGAASRRQARPDQFRRPAYLEVNVGARKASTHGHNRTKASRRHLPCPVPRPRRQGARPSLQTPGRRPTVARRDHHQPRHRRIRCSWRGPDHVREYAEAWRAVQIHRAGTVVQVEGALRRRVYPVIGDRPLESIVPSDIQQLVKRLERELSPASVIVTYRYVATIFKAASRDRRIALSPCDRIRLPKIVKKPVAPMATSDIQSLAEAVPKRYHAMVILAAGPGLRQGEIFGLTLDRVDFLRRIARVDRQLVGIRGHAPTFGPPKTASSVRTVPLPDVVLEALSEHPALPARSARRADLHRV